MGGGGTEQITCEQMTVNVFYCVMYKNPVDSIQDHKKQWLPMASCHYVFFVQGV
jgi:hypothetical protein